ncbi:hypothetical protein [Novosphingobium album (ex Liu et al. 2023)]|uniref:Uncharacterized protein n=1 Tax=Novosphingobium album (ex Liu et al. 2023) TaxID=3031130 RepID=A0ABT5WY20_9SPHN|nr:hypothetical protein [Novosphingobium album (ex Liu et al. 2023)]MDE8654808.1 hypothetical protein [Novosphingobium album (ex Liu et al. 2023)]
MVDDRLKDAPRLGPEALEACAFCGRAIPATESPIFYRVTLRQCGMDMHAVSRHLGLVAFFGGGDAGSALARAMGPCEQPVVQIARGQTNVCMRCANDHPDIMTLHAVALEGGA